MSVAIPEPGRGYGKFLLSRGWAVLILVPLVAAIVVLSLQLSDAHDALNHQEVALKAQRAVSRSNRHVLTELCKTNAIILGLVRGTVTLFEYQTGILPPPLPGAALSKPLVSPKLVPVYLQALNTFSGWQSELEKQTACETIKRP